MDMKYCIIAGVILYGILFKTIDIADEIAANQFRKKYFKCLKERDWTIKISKKIFQVENRKKIYFNVKWLLSGYDREYLFWKRKINFVCRMVTSCLIFSMVIYLVFNWKEVLLLIDWNTFVKSIKKIYELIKSYFSILLILLIGLFTIIFSRYKRFFEGIVNDKKRNELKDSLDTNCKLAIEFNKLNFELYKLILENFDNRGMYINCLKDIIFETIFNDILFDGTNYTITKIRRICSETNERSYFTDDKISDIIAQITDIG